MRRDIFDDFLEQTHGEGLALAQQSDVMTLRRLPAPGVGLWLIQFKVPYLRWHDEALNRDAQQSATVAPRMPATGVRLAAGPLEMALQLTPKYLIDAQPIGLAQVANGDFFHPNYRFPFLCIGEVRPGLGLPTLIRHLFEIATYANFATDHGLNPLACRYLVEHPEALQLLPPAPRLLRRTLEVKEEAIIAN